MMGLAWCSLLLVAAQEPTPQLVDSRLEQVTVFSQKALVERVFEVASERAGELEVRVGPLPVLAERDSMQVRVLSGEVEVQGLEVRLRNAVGVEDTRTHELREALAKAQDEARGVRTELAGLEARQEALGALVASAADYAEDPARLDAFMEIVAERAVSIDRERVELEKAGGATDAQIEELKRDLAARVSEARPVQELVLPLRFAAPGTAQFRLLYLVSNASWEPSYEIRVATDLTGVAMAQVARVLQSTGEDWEGVELRLSTAMPSRGLAAPELPRRFYQLPFSAGPDLGGLAAEVFGAGVDPALITGGSTTVAGDRNLSVSSGVLAQFRVSGTRTLRSGGEVSRFQLASLPLDVRPERYVVPSLSDRAWLRAEIRYTGSGTLIPGRGRVYLGGDLLGETQIPMMQTGDRTTVGLGPDPNVQVRFQTVLDERREPGILSSTTRIVRGYQADVRLDPGATGPVQILVEERLPRSRDERVSVKPTRLNPAPLDDPSAQDLREQQGIYRWGFELAPGASRRISWGYEASFDEDLAPVLIER
ncbi:MAG: DUF4139 domain-containing protein [Planctomycetes bacterium]|nr:DUF4139 domain-containing protein [Planctomycetota bacterium]